jgi:hypothetical protein
MLLVQKGQKGWSYDHPLFRRHNLHFHCAMRGIVQRGQKGASYEAPLASALLLIQRSVRFRSSNDDAYLVAESHQGDVITHLPAGYGHQRLLPPVQPPQRLLRVDILANTVDVKGIIPSVPGERAIAVRTQAVDIAAPVGGIDL